MAKRKKDDGSEFLFYILALPLVFIFIINAIGVNRYFTKKYPLSKYDVRVTDSHNFMMHVLALFSCSCILIAIIAMLHHIHNGYNIASKSYTDFICIIILSLFFIYIFIFGFVKSARMGTSQIGMLIFPKKGKFVIPTDPQRNTFIENYFQLKYLSDMYSMEELHLEDIKKITKEGGKKAFIHGTFGTRCIEWRNKQKRDECIATLERECKRRLSSFDAGY